MKVAILTTDNREHHRNYSCDAPYFGAAPEALIQGFSSLERVEVHVVSCTQQSMRSPKKLGQNIWFHSLHVPKIGWLRSGYQGCVRAVRNKLREIDPDIVHGQGTERDCALSAVFSGYPNVVTIHGNMAELSRLFKARIGSYGWLAGKLEDFTIRRTEGVLCNSDYTESLVLPRTQKTWRVANPIRSLFFEKLPSRSKNPRPLILNIGNISPRKRQVETLKMLQYLYSEGHYFEVLFVGACGNDEYGRSFRSILAESNSSGFARYMGYMTTEELVNAMDASDALCHFPSEEAFGLVVAEALARNLKLFGSATGGVEDIAQGIEGAELFSTDDWSSISVGISRWIKDGHPRLHAANQIMRERYHPKVIVDNHLKIYQEVINKKVSSETLK